MDDADMKRTSLPRRKEVRRLPPASTPATTTGATGSSRHATTAPIAGPNIPPLAADDSLAAAGGQITVVREDMGWKPNLLPFPYAGITRSTKLLAFLY